jgi:ribose 5-phosphate isomerase A
LYFTYAAAAAACFLLFRLAALPEVAGCQAKLRMEGDKPYVTDNSNYIVDLYFEVSWW